MSELVRQDKMRQRAYRLAAGALRNRADLVDTYEKAIEVSLPFATTAQRSGYNC